MSNNVDGIERVALEMIERFGDRATHVARKLAEVSDQVQDKMLPSAAAWCAIADAIERLSRKSQKP
jgi:hypothetical protein